MLGHLGSRYARITQHLRVLELLLIACWVHNFLVLKKIDGQSTYSIRENNRICDAGSYQYFQPTTI